MSTASSSFHDGLEMLVALVIRHFTRFVKERGLSIHQVHALMYIYHAGECQVSDIGALADVSNAAASQLVERLVQQDLVERREDPANRRSKIVRLSEKGKGLIRDSLPPSQGLMEIMASLTPEERDTVHAALEILARAARGMPIAEKGKDGQDAQDA